MQEQNPNIKQALGNSTPNVPNSFPKLKYSINKRNLLILTAIVLALFVAFVFYNLWNFGTVKIGSYYINAWQPTINNEAYFYFGKSDREKAQSEFEVKNSDETREVITNSSIPTIEELPEEKYLIMPPQTYTEEDVLKVVTDLKDVVSEKSAIERGKLEWPAIRSDMDHVYNVDTYLFRAAGLVGKDSDNVINYFKNNLFEDLYGDVGGATFVSWDFQKDNIVCDVFVNVYFPEDWNPIKMDKESLSRTMKVQCGLLIE